MLLRLGVHVARADSDERRAAVADLFAFFVELLAERLREELDVPLGDGLHVVAVRHHDFDVTAVLLGGSEFQERVEHGGVLPDVVVLARLIHVFRAVQERLDVKADARRERQADFAEDREASADAVGDGVLRPVVLHGELLEERRLLFVRVGDGDDFLLDIGTFLELVVDDEEVRHRVERAARFRDDEQEDLQLAALMRLRDFRHLLDVRDEVVRALRVDVVAGEIDFREATPLFFRQRVPELAALHVEEDFVAEVGAADAERDNDINVVFHVIRELLQVLERRRGVQMAFLDVRQLREQDFLRLAVLREVRADEAFLAHDLQRLVRFLEVGLVELQVVLRDFALAVQVVIVELEPGLQFQTHDENHSSFSAAAKRGRPKLSCASVSEMRDTLDLLYHDSDF